MSTAEEKLQLPRTPARDADGYLEEISTGVVTEITQLSNATLIRHSADLNVGSSGGVTLNAKGEVIGLIEAGAVDADPKTGSVLQSVTGVTRPNTLGMLLLTSEN